MDEILSIRRRWHNLSDGEVVVFGLYQFGRRLEHPCRRGQIGPLLDQNEGARQAVAGVAIEDQWSGSAQLDFANVIYGELVGIGLGIEGIHIDAAVQAGHDGLYCLAGMLEKVFSSA